MANGTVRSCVVTFPTLYTSFVKVEVMSVYSGYSNQRVGVQEIEIYLEPGKVYGD